MSNTVYYVCHGPEVVHLVEVYGNSTVTSGQPNIEQFDTIEEALALAIEFGYEQDKSDLEAQA